MQPNNIKTALCNTNMQICSEMHSSTYEGTLLCTQKCLAYSFLNYSRKKGKDEVKDSKEEYYRVSQKSLHIFLTGAL